MERMSASYRWWRSGGCVFCKEEPLDSMIRGLDDRSPKVLLKQSGRSLPKGRSFHAESSVDISELRKWSFDGSFMTSCKSSIFVEPRMRYRQTRRANASLIRVSFSRSLKKYKELVSSEWLLAMSHGSFYPIHITRIGQHREMGFLKELVRKLPLKSV
jgi:hypothetical protein